MDAKTRERIERLEEAVTTLAAMAGYADSTVRKETEGKLREIVRDTRVRVEQRLEDETERIQFTGRNSAEIDEFAGTEGTVQADEKSGALWLVGHGIDGTSLRLRPGLWLARDMRRHIIYETRPIAGVIE